ncbi:MAG: hypothetical protein WDA02_03310 [Saccharofermentanales bacterium]
MKNKYVKSFEEMNKNKNLNISDVRESKTYSDIEPLTIQEFSLLREAMYAVKESNSPSAFQAKEFFKNEENFELVVEKLRKLLTYGSEIIF